MAIHLQRLIVKKSAIIFFILFNFLHLSLRFTFEKECNGFLLFLDVLVEKSEAEFIASVYRKSTFTDQFLQWNTFCPSRRKISLINNTQVHRALMICSSSKL